MTGTIGFIGLGHMGHPMVKNLLKAGYQVKVYDVLPNAVQSLKEAGAIPVSSPAAAAENAAVVFTMLQTGEQVMDVCVSGLFAALKKDTLYIDSSSIDINVSKKLHQTAWC